MANGKLKKIMEEESVEEESVEEESVEEESVEEESKEPSKEEIEKLKNEIRSVINENEQTITYYDMKGTKLFGGPREFEIGISKQLIDYIEKNGEPVIKTEVIVPEKSSENIVKLVSSLVNLTQKSGLIEQDKMEVDYKINDMITRGFKEEDIKNLTKTIIKKRVLYPKYRSDKVLKIKPRSVKKLKKLLKYKLKEKKKEMKSDKLDNIIEKLF